jgi:predicted ATPase
MGHRLTGASSLFTGDIAKGRAQLDQAIALYHPAEHHSVATRFGQDPGVAILSDRSWALWLLGYPEVALRDADDALGNAREMGQAATLMYALSRAPILSTLCGNRAAATAQAQELIALAEEKGSSIWKTRGMVYKGGALVASGRPSDAIQMITAGIAALLSMGATFLMPFYLPYLARAYAELRQFEEAWRSIGKAITAVETTKERWCEPDIYRTAAELALLSPEPDAVKAEVHFERAIAIAREQKARSWELRAAIGMARLWCDQDKRQQARDLLAPIYDWFTEGFDTLDLKRLRRCSMDCALNKDSNPGMYALAPLLGAKQT